MAGISKGRPKKGAGKAKKAADPDRLTKSRKGAEIELTEEQLKRVTGAGDNRSFKT